MKINEKNLCVFASSPPYDLTGFLNKRGEVNKAFQKRYFVLKGNLLFYFEKKGDKEPLGLIIVEGCTIELSAESNDQYCFEIAFNGNRTYILSADSQESMETWMKALTCAGYEYKKLVVAELQRQLEEIEGTRNKILSEPSIVSVHVPKPPPRRQNPFNRPAPPLPVPNGNTTDSTTNATFINGHFGSTAQRTGTGNNPVAPPRGIPLTNSKTDFNQQEQLSAKSSTFYTSNSSTTTATDMQNHNTSVSVSVSFAEMHEKYRPIVMKDVLEYHLQKELKTRPLIEL